jgi:hypothetical protein
LGNEVIDIKKFYSHFVILFLVLVLSSSALVDPRSWWSIHKVVEIYDNGFAAQLSGVKISFYALFALFLLAIINQPTIKNTIKSFVNNINTFTNLIKN